MSANSGAATMAGALEQQESELSLRQPRSRDNAWRRLRRDRAGFAICIVSIAIIAAALLAPAIAPHDPLAVSPRDRLHSPSLDHLFGTDELGRDILSRVLYGARLSLSVAIISVLFAVVIGIVVGMMAGYFGGIVDAALMRTTDVFLAVPFLVLAMAIAAALGSGLRNAVIAVAVAWWPGYARQVRAQVLATKELPYVEAAKSIGAAGFYLNRRHILPNCVAPITARMTIDVGYVVIAMASLSFIGLGSRPPDADWGTMMAVARNFLLSDWTYPTTIGLTISICILILTLAGDAVEEALGVDLARRG
jgi:peptide/nickel transport system permease protein